MYGMMQILNDNNHPRDSLSEHPRTRRGVRRATGRRCQQALPPLVRGGGDAVRTVAFALAGIRMVTRAPLASAWASPASMRAVALPRLPDFCVTGIISSGEVQ